MQSVRELYYQIVQTQTQIESAEANVKTLIALQPEIDRKLVELAVLKSDSLAVRARLSQQRYQLVKLRDESKTQKESFNRLLGRDLETEFSIEVEPVPPVEEIDLAAAQTWRFASVPKFRKPGCRRRRPKRKCGASAPSTSPTSARVSHTPHFRM